MPSSCTISVKANSQQSPLDKLVFNAFPAQRAFQACGLSLLPAELPFGLSLHQAHSILLLSQESCLSLRTEAPRQTFQERTLGAWYHPPRSSLSADAFLPKGLEGPQGGGKDVIGAAAKKRGENRTQLFWCPPRQND